MVIYLCRVQILPFDQRGPINLLGFNNFFLQNNVKIFC